MITEVMVTKVLTTIGMVTVANKVVVPTARLVGTQVGRGVGKLVMMRKMKGAKANQKEKAKAMDMKRMKEIQDLIAECDEALKDDPEAVCDNTNVVEMALPEPKFDPETRAWIQRCKDLYGGFPNIDLD